MRLRIWLVLCALLFAGGTVHADSVALPSSYTQPVGDQFVFVMLAQNTGMADETGLNQEYPASGLYQKSAKEPLWTVDWYAYQGQVFLTPDGTRLAQMGPWPGRGDFGELAVAFYAEGKLLTRYRVMDLVSRPERLQESVSHYMWLDSVTFDEAAGVLTVKTIPGEIYRFTVETGQIQPDRAQPVAAGSDVGAEGGAFPRVGGLALWGVGGAVGVAAVVWLLRRRFKGSSHP